MTTSISMPQLGESVAEGTIGKWLKAPGERVERDEPIVEVITDKVNAEIPSPVAGVLERIVVPEGETVSVGAEIAVIGDASAATGQPAQGAPSVAGAGTPATGGPTGAGARSVESVPSEEASPALVAEVAASGTGSQTAISSLSLLREEAAPAPRQSELASAPTVPSQPSAPETNGAPKRASPFVRSLARKYGIDLGRVSGTGLGGRVTKDDILRFIDQEGSAPVSEQADAATTERQVAAAVATPTVSLAPPSPPTSAVPSAPPAPPAPQAPAAPPAAATQPATPSASQPLGADEELVPLLPMRRAIAEHMVRSLQTSPHAWSMVEIDVTKLVRLRAGLVEAWKAREGFELTYLPFFVKAVVEALRENPILNARWSDQGAVLKKRVNIGIAVAIENGLVVPVIRDADQKSISGIAREVREVAGRARGGRLTMDDLQGGTFTVNNTGALGSIASGPIINQPQAGIITMEAIVKRPVVTEDDAIAIHSMMNSCLSFDHRVLDGAEALRFLQSVKRRMEAYGPGTTIY